jgi:hypothetical protein
MTPGACVTDGRRRERSGAQTSWALDAARGPAWGSQPHDRLGGRSREGSDAGMRTLNPLEHGHEAVLHAPQGVGQVNDSRVVQYPRDPLQARPQRPRRLFELLDDALELTRDPLRRVDRLPSRLDDSGQAL